MDLWRGIGRIIAAVKFREKRESCSSNACAAEEDAASRKAERVRRMLRDKFNRSLSIFLFFLSIGGAFRNFCPSWRNVSREAAR